MVNDNQIIHHVQRKLSCGVQFKHVSLLTSAFSTIQIKAGMVETFQNHGL